jgi:hypothetical protein
MICPECKSEMTHHASRVIEPRTDEEREAMDEELGGIVIEGHTCPACGLNRSRLGTPSP